MRDGLVEMGVMLSGGVHCDTLLACAVGVKGDGVVKLEAELKVPEFLWKGWAGTKYLRDSSREAWEGEGERVMTGPLEELKEFMLGAMMVS